MKPLQEYTKETILAEEVFVEIFNIEDEIKRARTILSLQERAKQLKCDKQFGQLLVAYKKVAKTKIQTGIRENVTRFSGPYPQMKCKYWIAQDDGVFRYKTNGDLAQDLACYHPILPVERMRNMETGEEKIKLAYRRGRSWDEIIVPKTVVASSRSIVQLASRGVAVTSENAKYLVQYLSDVENSNSEQIAVTKSTSKLGWHGTEFIPYDKTDIVFDGNDRFSSISESIRTSGSEEAWYDHVLKLRKSGRQEIKIMLAASFASILISMVNGLPYIVDLWGETEGGKTVTLMLAASVWADPSEGAYIGDFKTTDTALEAKADLLNNLPLILDDTSKVSNRIRDNFEGVVYDLCSGKGKSRSNKELGINRENHWKCGILTNGERPLVSYVSQGGAINRIIEVECGDNLYKDPQKTVEVLKANYGWAGRDFIESVRVTGPEIISKLHHEIYKEVAASGKMQKQSLALSIILTADRLATDCLFKDNEYIDLKDAEELLSSKDEVSDNERCYRYILDKIGMNSARFDSEVNIEQWGEVSEDYAYLFPQALDQICSDGGYNRRVFLAWADKNKLLSRGNDDNHFTVKMKVGKDKKWRRCIALRITEIKDNEDSDGLKIIQGEQIDLPFN